MSKQFDKVKQEEAMEIQREQQRKQQRKSSAAAPQVVADERSTWGAAQNLMDVIDGFDGQLVPINKQSVTCNDLRVALQAAPVQPVAVPDGYSAASEAIKSAIYGITGPGFLVRLGELDIGKIISDAMPTLAAPAAQDNAKGLTDADFKKGELGWRPKCCDGGGAFSNCCDYGGCAANRERAAIAAKAAS